MKDDNNDSEEVERSSKSELPDIVDQSEISSSTPSSPTALSEQSTHADSILDQKFPKPGMCVWERSSENRDVEGLEVRRVGTTEYDVRVLLYPNFIPDHYQLSPLLSELLSIHSDTKPRIILALWHYIIRNHLQDGVDQRLISNNDKLKAIFHVDKMKFSTMVELIESQLSPLSPIELKYHLKLSGEPVDNATTFDVTIHIPSLPPAAPNSSIPGRQFRLDVNKYNENLEKVLRQIDHHRRKKLMFDALHDTPNKFLSELVDSQIRDFKLSHLLDGQLIEPERQPEYFHQPLLPEAISSYLAGTS